MKKAEIIARINEIAQSQEIDELTQLVEELNKAPEPRTKKKYFIKVNERVIEENVKYPFQMIELHKILEEIGEEDIALAEVKEIMSENSDRLKTKQDPYRIYAYYQKRMEDEGWIERWNERESA